MFEYMKLEIRRVLRDRRYLIFSIGFPLGFYLMYTRAVAANDTVDHMPWATFYMVSMATFGAIGAALQTGGTRVTAERANGWIKQLRATPSLATTRLSAGEGRRGHVCGVPVGFPRRHRRAVR